MRVLRFAAAVQAPLPRYTENLGSARTRTELVWHSEPSTESQEAPRLCNMFVTYGAPRRSTIQGMTTTQTPTESAVTRRLFAHDAEYAHRTDRALWRAECVALALIISAEVPAESIAR